MSYLKLNLLRTELTLSTKARSLSMPITFHCVKWYYKINETLRNKMNKYYLKMEKIYS